MFKDTKHHFRIDFVPSEKNLQIVVSLEYGIKNIRKCLLDRTFVIIKWFNLLLKEILKIKILEKTD